LAAISGPIFQQSHAQNAATVSASGEGALIAVPEEAATAQLRIQRDRLLLENQVREETLRKELAATNSEYQRLKGESDLAKIKADRELAQKRTEIERARIEIEQIGAQQSLESARLEGQQQKELAALRTAKERAELEADLALAEFSRKNNEFKAQEVTWNTRLVELRAQVAEREKLTEAEAYVEQRPVYSTEPLQPNGDLIISDRRIPLNGPITAATGDFICDRIDFYNNKSKVLPIFIVIDESPGGSVMAGYKILKSMQSSTAPVYVLVKSYAASMAAAICTLAPHSFAYPNAIILHHQISNGLHGNLAAQREGVKLLEEWWQRLAAPIAKKMGISIEEFSNQLYAHSSTGDWQEFADHAVKLKWVDVVVNRCQETALLKDPGSERLASGQLASNASFRFRDANAIKADAPGTPRAFLPRLSPLDCYYLYNPDGYYQSE
jgi:ATP-dependent Clp protease protease subunit